MKKRLIILGLCLFLISSISYADTATSAVSLFKRELGHIKQGLKTGKLTPAKASVLVSAIQVRQNLVLIEQNDAILALLKKQRAK